MSNNTILEIPVNNNFDSLEQSEPEYKKSLLRLTTCGSVDDGKSTLIGRLLFETDNVFDDQFSAVKEASERRGKEGVELALLLDGLSAEREQGITIDVAYRYFTTKKRKFIIADSPGHEQYTRNMVTGASTANLAIILVDARLGVLTQSKRHGFISSLLGIPHLVVAVNKMDLVEYSKSVFEMISNEYKEFAKKLNIQDIRFIPVSALKGDNVVTKSKNMGWYEGPTLLNVLETVHIESDVNLVDFRFPVQYVIRPDLKFRGYAGCITSGIIRVGEKITILPSGMKSTIKEIVTFDGKLDKASAGQSVVLQIEDHIDISRGQMIVRCENLPNIVTSFDATLCWFDEDKLETTKQYILKHTTNAVGAFVSKISYQIDVNTLHRIPVDNLVLNDIGRVSINTTQPLFVDPYKLNRTTGSFILIDPHTNRTVAAGMIRAGSNLSGPIGSVVVENVRTHKVQNIFASEYPIKIEQIEKRNGHRSSILWMTGLSGSGKSTIAKLLVKKLYDKGVQAVMLDGDNLRCGITADLGFSKADRSENVRRVSYIAKLFADQGFIVICTLITPYKRDRITARTISGSSKFYEVYVKCDISLCKCRDPKGLYKKAHSGEIEEFTGVDAPYEEPQEPDVIIDTSTIDESRAVELLMERLRLDKIIG